ncbi:MAG: YbaY family lipoprotein [Thiohalophilus sp.]|jgi:putative lipoprotein
MKSVKIQLDKLFLIAVLIIATGCTVGAAGENDASDESMQQVTGKVFYRERMMLPPGSVVEVSLLDVSRADAKARTLAHQVIKNPSVPPISFVLEYDSKDIDPRMSYAVRAIIRHEGRLLFTTDTLYPVITRGAGNTVDIMLKHVARSPVKPNASLVNTYWKLVSFADQAYEHKSKNREPHLILVVKDNIAKGSGGCNMFTGHYETDANSLRFQHLAATLRACVDGMQIESRYLSALGKVNRYVIQGETLRLYRDDELMLEFEAVYF